MLPPTEGESAPGCSSSPIVPILSTRSHHPPRRQNGELAQSRLELSRERCGKGGCVKAMFDHIRVPLARSALAACVLLHAAAVAHAFQPQVARLTVLERGVRLDCKHGVDPRAWPTRKAEAETYLRHQADRLRETGLPLERRTLAADPTAQTIAFAPSNMVADLLAAEAQRGSGHRASLAPTRGWQLER